MNRFAIPVLMVLACSLSAQAQPKTPPKEKGDVPDVSASVKLIVERTNAFRKEEKLEPVKANAELTKAAEYFAKFMAKTDKYGHTADDKTPPERAKEYGYKICVVLENIAWLSDAAGFSTDKLADGFVTGWKKSPGHRKNMLDPDITETGVAIARSAETGRYYAVQMFGRHQSQAIVFKVTNRTDAEMKYQIGDQSYDLPKGATGTHTLCRSQEIIFQKPDALATSTKDKPLKPVAGDKIAITGSKGKYRVGKE